jgi:ABC-type amino acid transport substrate-binding protein
MTQSETNLTAAGISSVLTVGLDDAPPAPMQIGTPEDGDFRGYEVDLLEALGCHL